jgi:hypothetical protein
MLKLTNISVMRTAIIIIALMMEAVHTSETSVNFNVTTWCYIPEDSKLHTCHREIPALKITWILMQWK